MSQILKLIIVAVLCAASAGFARNFAFPSPLPPTGGGPGTPGWDTIRQIVSFIWDDNAYSGMRGTSYEGAAWLAANNAGGADFSHVSWVGGYRAREGDWSPGGNRLNDLRNARNTRYIDEGDIGMAWAAYTLSGVELDPDNIVPRWSPLTENHAPDARVIYDGQIWRATGHIGQRLPPSIHNAQTRCVEVPWGTGIQCDAHWELVGPVPAPTRTRTNPDGSPITMTFNVITGLFTAVSPGGPGSYLERQSRFGWFEPNAQFYPGGVFPQNRHRRVPAAWGRENAIFNTFEEMLERDNTIAWADGTLEEIFRRTVALGHEIGNHTIDHMETNSPLPYRRGDRLAAFPGIGNAPGNPGAQAHLDGFARWQGEGMAGGPTSAAFPFGAGNMTGVQLPDGSRIEVEQSSAFGQERGNVWQYMGWHAQAGRMLSVNAWQGLIALGEEELAQTPGLGDFTVRGRSELGGAVTGANRGMWGFRAPRLETNSNLLHALNNLGYLFDTGWETGYELNVDGTNFLWPFTVDNGSPNMAHQRASGANQSNWDSLPGGLWQYHVSVFIVPENMRSEIFGNYARIARAENRSITPQDSLHFLSHGKITGFDFNLFILWGATEEIATATLKESLRARLRGGRAPFQVGSHTDYFTPIYDHATLLNAVNRGTFGLNVTEGWNTWRCRIRTYENFVDYALSRGAFIKCGRRTIEYVQMLANQVRVGEDITTVDNWTHFSHTSGGGITRVSSPHVDGQSLASGATIRAEQTANNSTAIVTGFAAWNLNFPDGFDHISLEYSVSAPITIRLLVDGSELDAAFPYEVTLSNLNGWNNWNDISRLNTNRFVRSHEIPLHAFQRNQNIANSDNPEWRARYVGLQPPTHEFSKTVTGIEISVQKPTVSAFSWRSGDANFNNLISGVRDQNNFVAIRNFRVHSGERTVTGGAEERPEPPVSVARAANRTTNRTAVMGMTANNLNLSIARTGTFNIDIVTANGRVVRQFRDMHLTAGVNNINLGGLARGMYMIRIHNANFNTTLRSMVR